MEKIIVFSSVHFDELAIYIIFKNQSFTMTRSKKHILISNSLLKKVKLRETVTFCVHSNTGYDWNWSLGYKEWQEYETEKLWKI